MVIFHSYVSLPEGMVFGGDEAIAGFFFGWIFLVDCFFLRLSFVFVGICWQVIAWGLCWLVVSGGCLG